MAAYPTRWCSQCQVDWPQHTTFNLCPKCGRCTTHETSDVKPDETAMRVLAGKYRAFAEYEEKFWQSMEDAFAATPHIPDPDPTPPKRARLEPGKYRGRPPRDWTGDATPDGA